MKKLVLIASVLFLGSAAFSQLSGTYTIYGTTPDYATIQDACTDLQTSGQSGPVIFNIRDGAHSEVITLNAVTGNSATNTITFQSESADSTAVSVSSSTSNTFTFTDVNYVNFNNINLVFTGPFGEAVRFNNTGDGVSFSNTSLFYNSINGTEAIHVNSNSDVNDFTFSDSYIYSYFGGIRLNASNGEANNFTISGSEIESTGDGINIFANDAADDLTISNSDISTGFGNAVYVQGINNSMNNISISNSMIYSVDSYAFYGFTLGSMNNANITGSEITSDNNYGFYAESIFGGVNGWTVSNTNVAAFNDAFYLVAQDAAVMNVSFMNDSIISNPNGNCCPYEQALYITGWTGIDNVNIQDSYFETDSADYGDYAIYLYSDNGEVSNINLENSRIKSYYGMYIYADGMSQNWNFDNNIVDTQYDAMYFESYGGVDNVSFTNNDMEAADEDGIYISADGLISNVNFNNNTLWSLDYTIELTSFDGVDMVTIDNNTVYSDDNYAIYLNTYNGVSNAQIINNDIDSYDYGVYIYSDNGDILDIDFSDNVTNSLTGSDGYLLEGYGDIMNVEIMNDSVTSGLYGIDFYSNGVTSNVNIENTYVFAAEDGIYFYADDQIQNVNVSNCEIYTDTSYVTCCPPALYFGTSGAPMSDMNVEDNVIFGTEYGISFESSGSNSSNINIANNDVTAGVNGIYVDGAGNNINIDNNNLYPNLNYGNQLEFGIYTYGDYGPSSGVSITNNYMENIQYIGTSSAYHNDLQVNNNVVISDQSTNGMWGIEAQYIGGNSTINSNQILTESELYGIRLYEVYGNSGNPFMVSNNFITGFQSAFYLEFTGDIDINHNSVSSPVTTSMNYMVFTGDVNFRNNIFKNHNTSGDIYYGNPTANIMIDYNAYHYDTTAAMMSSTGDFGSYASPYDFMVGTSYDMNSIYTDPMFNNDTTDLHVSCSATQLSAGTPTSVMTDIDGVARNATNPTIGAHEIDPSATDLVPDSVYFCNTADLFCAVSGSYSWSTGETTQGITVTSVGTYTVTHTDACGNVSMDSTVVWTDMPTADFVYGTNGQQAVFNNQSTGGTSYMWDFGDGNTSTDENPVHNYASTGTFTVLLTVTNACGGMDTVSQVIDVFNVGIDQSLESRGFNVYPNPTQSDFVIDFGMLLGEDISIIIIDMDGRVVLTDMISNQEGAFQKHLSLVDFADGIYFLRVDSDSESITRKIIKQ